MKIATCAGCEQLIGEFNSNAELFEAINQHQCDRKSEGVHLRFE